MTISAVEIPGIVLTNQEVQMETTSRKIPHVTRKKRAKAPSQGAPDAAATVSEVPVRVQAPDIQAPQEALGAVIAVNMCGVDVVIRRPQGSIRIPGVKVMAVSETGEDMQVRKTTSPGFIIDEKCDHPIWGEIDINQSDLKKIVERYSINDARRGFHLVPMSRTGNMLVELRAKRQERLDLVARLKRPEEWELLLSNLRRKYPDHFHLLQPRMPNPDLLLEKFDVTWSLNPLTPIDPNTLNFNSINDTDRQAIIDESNRMAQSLVKSRAQSIYDLIFGEFLSKCDAIVAGSFETGNRKFSDVEVLVSQLERLKNFSEFGTAAMAAHADNTLQVLRQIGGRTDIAAINANGGQNQVTAAIKAAITPLQQEIQAMYQAAQPGSGRSGRTLE